MKRAVRAVHGAGLDREPCCGSPLGLEAATSVPHRHAFFFFFAGPDRAAAERRVLLQPAALLLFGSHVSILGSAAA